MNNLPISTYFKSRNFDQVDVILRIYKEFHELTNKNIRDKTNQLIINSHFNILKALRKLLLSENPEEYLRNSLNFRELEQIHTKLLAEDTFDKKDTFTDQKYKELMDNYLESNKLCDESIKNIRTVLEM